MPDMAGTAAPPTAPDVAAQQQGSPLEQYADAAQQDGGNGFAKQPSGIEMIETLFNEVAEKLNQAAKVASMVNPAMIEYIKKMSQVGAEAMKDIQSSKQQKSQGGGSRAGLEPGKTEGPSGAALAA